MDRINWQAPGNSKIFNSKLDRKNAKYITNRTIMVMKFFSKKLRKEDPNLGKELDLFLKENFTTYKENDSIKKHFYNPLLFFGLLIKIKKNDENFLVLSIYGKQFLESFENNDHDSSVKYFFVSTLWTSYPNIAATETKLNDDGFFPFRILFYLLKKKGSLPSKEIEEKVIFINKIDDLKNYDEFKENFHSDELKLKSKPYKFITWVIHSLLDVGILVKNKNFISLSKKIRNLIDEENIDLDSCENFFFRLDDSVSYINSKWHYTKIDSEDFPKRSRKLAKEILAQSNYLCFLESIHKSFVTNEGNNYMEAHHIIPFSLGKIIKGKNSTDIKENLISLCPNCHKAMHYSENLTKVKMLEKIWNYKEKELINLNYTKDDLYQIYLNNVYLGATKK